MNSSTIRKGTVTNIFASVGLTTLIYYGICYYLTAFNNYRGKRMFDLGVIKESALFRNIDDLDFDTICSELHPLIKMYLKGESIQT